MSDPIAAANSLKPLFWPSSVAVLGASDNPNKIGGLPVRYFREHGYEGAFYPVNPGRETVQGLPAYASLDDIEGPVDVAILAVPGSASIEAAESCAAKGVKALVVFTAGFAEVGEDGRAQQERLREIGRTSGMRILGPNCLGYFNPGNGVYGTFSTSLTHGLPRKGNVGMVSQSGAFGSHCFVLGRNKGLGFSYWVTTGNEVDIDVADCISFFALDADTRVIAAYLEGCKDGEKFKDALALAYEKGKPVIIQKVGRSEVGAAAAASHTASMTGTDQVFDAVFERFNAYRARTVDELIDVAYACSAGIYPTGNRVAICTMSGGAGVMMADAAAEVGLDVAPLSEESQTKLKKLLPFSAVRNPVDFTAQAYNDFSLVTKNFETILAEDRYDAVVGFFPFLPSSDHLSEQILEALKPVREKFPDRLIVMSILGPEKNVRKFEEQGFVVIDEPARAMEVVAALVRIGRGFARDLPRPPEDPVPRIKAGSYDEVMAKRLLAEIGITSPPERLVTSAEEAAAAAEEIGLPVAMKIVSPDILHKTDIGGVALGLDSGDAVRAAYDAITGRAAAAHPEARLEGVLVSRMIEGGVETILGVQRDPTFGPVVMFGLGGVFAEILHDVAFRLAPFGEAEAREMIRSLKGHALLEGARGHAPADIDALAAAIARLSTFANVNAEVIDSIDVNPLLVLPRGEGIVALDALIVTRREEG